MCDGDPSRWSGWSDLTSLTAPLYSAIVHHHVTPTVTFTPTTSITLSDGHTSRCSVRSGSTSVTEPLHSANTLSLCHTKTYFHNYQSLCYTTIITLWSLLGNLVRWGSKNGEYGGTRLHWQVHFTLSRYYPRVTQNSHIKIYRINVPCVMAIDPSKCSVRSGLTSLTGPFHFGDI